jgi:hypothetical protein
VNSGSWIIPLPIKIMAGPGAQGVDARPGRCGPDMVITGLCRIILYTK